MHRNVLALMFCTVLPVTIHYLFRQSVRPPTTMNDVTVFQSKNHLFDTVICVQSVAKFKAFDVLRNGRNFEMSYFRIRENLGRV